MSEINNGFEDVELPTLNDTIIEIVEMVLEDVGLPVETTDSEMSEWIVNCVFDERIAWNKEFGWMAFYGCVWNRVSEQTIVEIVRIANASLHARFMAGGGGAALDATKVKKLLSAAKIKSIVALLAGQVQVDAGMFDQRNDLLNTPTGVVNLRTLEILKSDPKFYFTKITNVPYVPNARHNDVESMLTCLDAEERNWLCDRLGQALIGSQPKDATITLLVGFGANGKTSVMHAANLAAGTFFGRIPVTVLAASSKVQPNDKMTLRGVRVALIEEFPEGHTFSNRNLKEVVGTPVIQGRFLFKEFVEWRSTHTLFVTTNDLPRVEETDHGTWRRFTVMTFPYRYVGPEKEKVAGDKLADPDLLARIEENADGQLEAMLALMVEAAHANLFRGGKPLAPTVKMSADLESWRERCDKVQGFVKECVEFDASCHVSASDLYFVYKNWMESQGNKPMSQPNFISKFLEHETVRPMRVEKKRIRAGQWETTFTSPLRLFESEFQADELERYVAIRGVKFQK